MAEFTTSRRGFISGLGAAAAMAGLPAAHAQNAAPTELAKLYDAAKKEGRISFYCSNNPVLTARVVKAFNAWRRGDSITVLRWSPGGAVREDFPRVEDVPA